MFRRVCDYVCKPHVHLASLLLRLGLAAIFLFHGYLKIAVDGGRSWDNALPPLTQMVVAWGEAACGLALLLGFLSRLAAIGLIIMQCGAIALYTSRFDFIHIEYNRVDPHRIPTGAEYNVALIVMCLAVVALGSGMLSVDACLFGRRRKGPAP
jgi:uncharacterized membrane protein YphA (DoxX/SURF4 family)